MYDDVPKDKTNPKNTPLTGKQWFWLSVCCISLIWIGYGVRVIETNALEEPRLKTAASLIAESEKLNSELKTRRRILESLIQEVKSKKDSCI